MVDTWIGYLLRKVENMGLKEKTAVIFTSDHGFYFGEHGGLFGKMTFAKRADGSLYRHGELSLVGRSGIPMTSFTTLRFGSDTERYGEGLRGIGTVRYASYTGPAQRKHPYVGLEFCAIHSVELMLQYHGVDVVSVQAVESPPDVERSNIVAACSFADGTLVTLGLVGDGTYHFRMTAIGRDGVVDVSGAWTRPLPTQPDYPKPWGRLPPISRRRRARVTGPTTTQRGCERFWPCSGKRRRTASPRKRCSARYRCAPPSRRACGPGRPSTRGPSAEVHKHSPFQIRHTTRRS